MSVVNVDRPARPKHSDAGAGSTTAGYTTDRRDVLAVSAHGALGAAELPEFQRAFDDARARRPVRIVIDLVHADFLSIAAAEYLAGARARARLIGAELDVVAGESRTVRRALEVAGIATSGLPRKETP